MEEDFIKSDELEKDDDIIINKNNKYPNYIIVLILLIFNICLVIFLIFILKGLKGKEEENDKQKENDKKQNVCKSGYYLVNGICKSYSFMATYHNE